MPNKMEQAIEMSQNEAISAAEQKLGRLLTEGERNRIQHITSLMMLESICRAFTSPLYTADKVLADLESFRRVRIKIE